MSTAAAPVSTPALDRIRSTRRTLTALLGTGAILWGAAVLVGGLVVSALAYAAVKAATHGASPGPLLAILLRLLPIAALLGGVVTAGVLLWRARFARSLERVALWVEERAPSLRYALVTLVDPLYAASPARTQLDAVVAGVQTAPFLREAAIRTVLRPAAALLAAVAAFAVLPGAWRAALAAPAGGFSIGGPGVEAPLPNRLLGLDGTLTPPAYTGWRATRLDDPTTIDGLAGSRVVLRGPQVARGISVTLGGQSLAPHDAERGWAVEFTVPDSAVALTLTDRQYRRIIVIESRPDEAPVLKLRLPAHDTTLRTVSGSLALDANLADDVGLARGRFEFIIASGEGEGNFTFRSGNLDERTFGGTQTGRLSITVPFSQFALKEGDQFSIRAVAFDGNTLSGPGKGYSETRIIRVARQSEYDSLAVTPAPPSADTALMSLRMLIIATEKLEKQRPQMARAPFVAEAQKLAHQAETIRDKIKTIMDEQSGDGQFAVNPVYTEIYNYMWDGVRSLSVAEPKEALPPLKAAYAALKKLQNTQKYYVRGQSAPLIVNVDRVRMTGTDSVRASGRSPRAGAPTPNDRFATRYAKAVELLQHDSTRAVEELTVLRVESLRDLPALADALGQALAALQAHRDATAPLLAARRAIEGRPHTLDTLSAWSGTW